MHMRYLVVLFACLIITKANAQFDLGDTSKHYFPPKTVSKFENNWYSGQLAALKEPVIFSDKSNTEVYRFTWLRTFHNPIAIRIEKQGDKYLLIWKVCNGAGGYGPGKLSTSKQKTITKSEWDEFQNKLKTIDFWKADTELKNIGNDGSQWILEGKTPNQYHVTDRWTPKSNTLYYVCCDYLIGLTNLKITGDAKY